MKCFLILTIIAATPSTDNNTMPRTILINTFDSESVCIADGQSRTNDDFNKWIQFTDEQGVKKSRTECVCFEK